MVVINNCWFCFFPFQELKRQSSLALRTFHTVVISGDVHSGWKLMFNLWQLGLKSGKANREEIVKILKYKLGCFKLILIFHNQQVKAIEFVEEKSFELSPDLGELAKKMHSHLKKHLN